MKKKITRHFKRRRLVALYRIAKRRFSEIPGNNFPAVCFK
jgi:hypothetical protein